MAKPGQHPSMAEQLNELIAVIQQADLDEGPNAKRIAERGRLILSLAQQLAFDIGELTRRSAQHEVDVLVQYVRRKPLKAVAIAGAVGAMLVWLRPRSRRH